MKRQYLGDSRDSFKWDYHRHLVPALGARELQIVWMMAPGDGAGMAGMLAAPVSRCRVLHQDQDHEK